MIGLIVAYLFIRSEWYIVINHCPSTVRPFIHILKQHLLRKFWPEFFKSKQEYLFGEKQGFSYVGTEYYDLSKTLNILSQRLLAGFEFI